MQPVEMQPLADLPDAGVPTARDGGIALTEERLTRRVNDAAELLGVVGHAASDRVAMGAGTVGLAPMCLTEFVELPPPVNDSARWSRWYSDLRPCRSSFHQSEPTDHVRP